MVELLFLNKLARKAYKLITKISIPGFCKTSSMGLIFLDEISSNVILYKPAMQIYAKHRASETNFIANEFERGRIGVEDSCKKACLKGCLVLRDCTRRSCALPPLERAIAGRGLQNMNRSFPNAGSLKSG